MCVTTEKALHNKRAGACLACFLRFCHASPCAAAHSCPVMLPPRFAFFAGGGRCSLLESSAPPASSSVCEARGKGHIVLRQAQHNVQHNAQRAGCGGTAPPRGRAMRDHGGRARRATASRSALAWRPASSSDSLSLPRGRPQRATCDHAVSSQGTCEVPLGKGSPNDYAV